MPARGFTFDTSLAGAQTQSAAGLTFETVPLSPLVASRRGFARPRQPPMLLLRRSPSLASRHVVASGYARARQLSSAANTESVAVPEVEDLLLRGIKSIGYDHADAVVMKDAMMWAQLRDNNQGIIKLTSGGLAKSGDAEPIVEYDSPTGARVNGNQAMSMVVLERGVRLAIEKAQRS